MQLTNSPKRYGAIPQFVHWLTVICVLGAWTIGYFYDAFPRPWHHVLLPVHMIFGQCILVLVLARLVWRYANPPPPLVPTPLGRLLEIAAHLSHYLIYALLLAVPILGVILQLKRGNPLPVFGLWNFASPWPADRAIAHTIQNIHGLLANTLLILVGLHAVAALVHHYVFGDETLRRMLPGAGTDSRAGAWQGSAGKLSP